MPSQRTITPDVQAVEKAIDAEYLKNDLSRLSFSEAAWYFLAFCEETQLKYLGNDGSNGRQDLACHVDQIVNNMKMPLRWLFQSCGAGTNIPRRFSDDYYQASWDLSNLAHEYAWFETAYVYASADVITLQLHGDTIIARMPFRDDVRYEAYDRLCIDESPAVDKESLAAFFGNIEETVTVSHEHFRYRLNPRIVSQGLDVLSPLLNQFWLPASWELPRYTFGEYCSVLSTLRVLAMIHHIARVEAVRQGCVGMGYLDSVLLMDESELSNRLRRYTGFDAKVVNEIVRDTTFGDCGIRRPDPAIQPLIPLSSDRIAISPALFLGSNIERNFTVLLNRLPEEKKAYSQLSNEREDISRQRIIDRLESLKLRFWQGKLSGGDELPDLDLAIIDDARRSCLILELKAFIEPAEPREVLEKSKEVARGVSQIKLLQNAFQLNPRLLADPLKIGDTYDVVFAVASETSIGTPNVQDESVPVVRCTHLVRRLLAEKSLSAVGKWLRTREYLPVEGK
ncbi:MAG: hypothetical protein SGJ20_19485, partial [Planctomycetota bacterium]|nr:hypothetical protein [Planctomycetota bacterium]